MSVHGVKQSILLDIYQGPSAIKDSEEESPASPVQFKE